MTSEAIAADTKDPAMDRVNLIDDILSAVDSEVGSNLKLDSPRDSPRDGSPATEEPSSNSNKETSMKSKRKEDKSIGMFSNKPLFICVL